LLFGKRLQKVGRWRGVNSAKDFSSAVVSLIKNMKQTDSIMKKSITLAAVFFALAFTTAFGQPQPPIGTLQISGSPPSARSNPELTRFNLDFPGGRPADLVNAIEKASHVPLNVIINKEDENLELPPLKMNDVNVAQLFNALKTASRKSIAVSTGFGGSYSTFNSSYGFETDGTPTDNSIWYFRVDKPSMPPVLATDKTVRFYSLAQYLDRGFTVDDITTAIQTGWKMAGESSTPELNYHKETKLLIAYGTPRQLEIISSVLQNLPSTNASRIEIDNLNQKTGTLRSDIQRLQKQLNDLENKIAPQSRGAQPEEKSGK
jgi:hypothetical protein